MRKKVYLLSLVVLLAICMTAVFAQSAFATVVSPGDTGPQTGGSSSGSKTGAPMLAISAIGTALVGTGFLLKRKASQ